MTRLRVLEICFRYTGLSIWKKIKLAFMPVQFSIDDYDFSMKIYYKQMDGITYILGATR